eukprot:959460-Prorocentrum_minimum.AAC.2
MARVLSTSNTQDISKDTAWAVRGQGDGGTNGAAQTKRSVCNWVQNASEWQERGRRVRASPL